MENPIAGALPLQVKENYEGMIENHNLFANLQTDETSTYKVKAIK